MSSPVSLIVGLGNPGPQYERTRHNAGFWFIDELARRAGTALKNESKFHGEACKITLADTPVWLLKPMTFMNHSGQATAALANFYKIPIESILVAHDELDLAPGTMRLKRGGGHGGHNGLRDIVARHGGNDFMRLRIGIGHPGHSSQVTGYVLGKASSDDQIEIERGIDRAADLVELLVNDDLQRAMNQLHSA